MLTLVLAKLCDLRGWTGAEAERIIGAKARELSRLPIDVGAGSPSFER